MGNATYKIGRYISIYRCDDLGNIGFKITSEGIYAKDVISGKYGNGEDRKTRLTKEGYDYTIIQKRVNELLK